MNITVCGAGNAAQTLTALLASKRRHRVVVYAPMGDEAARLERVMGEAGIEALFADGRRLWGRPAAVTADPAQAGAGVEAVLLALPAFAHEAILRALLPHLPQGVWIGALPARGGFDWMARAALGGLDAHLFGLQTLPWACRIQEWGRRVDVLGVKAEIDLAAWPGHRAGEIAALLQELICVPLRPVSNFLALTLANSGQIIHPGILYGLFHRWDGAPFPAEQIPAFYGGVNELTADVLQMMSAEVQAVCAALQEFDSSLDLGSVAALDAWLVRSYPGQIDDASSLRAAFNTNRAYAGLRAPVTRVAADSYIPDFASRYLSEDVPYGLLVSRGVAELAGVPTPTISRVIDWAQVRLGREYLVDGRVAGRDVAFSQTPQRFAIDSLDKLLDKQ